MEILVKNKRAFFDYDIQSETTCGIILYGHEVKSIRKSHVSMKGSYAHITNGKLYVTGLNISEYKHANNLKDYDPCRKRILLANRKEIEKMQSKIDEKGFTLIPTYVGLEGNKIKVKIGIAKGKKMYDKKDVIKKRDTEKELRRNFKNL